MAESAPTPGDASDAGASPGPTPPVDPGQFLRVALDSSRVVVCALDRDGRIVYSEGEGMKVLGHSIEDVLGRTLHELHPGAEELHEALAAAQADGQVVATVPIEGTVWEIRCAPRTNEGGEPDGLVAVAIDVTDRARAETAAARATAELEAAHAELQDLAYVVSHDLKEPLRMVASYMRLLERRYAGVLDGDGVEFIHFAADGATRMQGLLEGLLAYSRIHTRGRPFEPMPVDAALDRAMRRLERRLDEEQAEVTWDDLPELHGDVEQIATVFEHLLDNALKFRSDEPPRIHVSAEEGPTHWVFAVEDNGIGIDAARSEEAFTLFRQLHGREAFPGIGAGLALARRIAQRHGGLAWVRPRDPDEDRPGTTVCFSLPKGDADAWPVSADQEDNGQEEPRPLRDNDP